MAREIRRIVTRQAGGLGGIESDGPAPVVFDLEGGQVTELWRVGPHGKAMPVTHDWGLEPPRGGSVFRITEFGAATADNTPWMHATETIDYAIVLEGEIVLATDEGETTLRAGDVVVQQAAWHGWVNRTDRISRMVFVLIDTGAK
jgi:quercetin dioxygenase-like cupin family protein